MRANDKIAIAWLSPGKVESRFAVSIAELYCHRSGPHGTLRVGQVHALLPNEVSGLLSRGRNEIAAKFLYDLPEAQWLLMIDSDEQLSVEGFDKLCAAAHDTERPIVAGLYFGAWHGDFFPTPVPLIFKEKPGTTRFNPIIDYPRDQVIPIDSAGTGCLLVHRSVLEKIAEFATPHQIAHYEDGTSRAAWCWFLDMPVNGDWYSEDHYFCAAARQAGFKLHAHTGVVLPHRKSYWIDERHALLNAPERLTAEELRQPMWAPLLGKKDEDEPETTEHKPANEKAVRARPRRSA